MWTTLQGKCDASEIIVSADEDISTLDGCNTMTDQIVREVKIYLQKI